MMNRNKVFWLIMSVWVLIIVVSATLRANEMTKQEDSKWLSPQVNNTNLIEENNSDPSARDKDNHINVLGKNFRMTFDDEFMNSDTIAKFGDYNGSKWYNGVEQCCMSDSSGLTAVNFPTKINGLSVDPYKVDNTNGLEITLSKVNNVWYSGVLTSVDRFGKGFSQQYGYFEIKAKLPPGPGTWPAFWMKSLSTLTTKDKIGEIDIFEQYGINQYGFCTTYHDWTSGTTPYYNCKNPTPNLTSDFHTWGFLWTEAESVVLFDGKEINRSPTPGVMKQPFYLIIDMGLGGGWPTEQTPNPSKMQIRYVRAYEYDGRR